MSKLPRPSVSRKSILQPPRPSTSRPSTSRPSTSRPSTSRPSVSRQSTSRQSVFARPSSIGLGPGSQKIDVKANVKQNVMEILAYLVEKEYPNTLTKKNLLNPTEATFKSVLKFIIKDFYPDFDCTRTASAVMELMVYFEYPYPLKETHFKPVGSPHSWPYLLQVLAWLCGMARNIEYELDHVSQLMTLNCKDEEEAEQELKHLALMSKYCRMSQETGEDLMALKNKYVEEWDIQGTIQKMKNEHIRIENELESTRHQNEKFAADEAAMKEAILQAQEESKTLDNDRKLFEGLISDHQAKTESLQEQKEECAEQLNVLKIEAEKGQQENARLEEIILSQPPQHDVQKIKQQYTDLLDKKRNLEAENAALEEENRKREVAQSKRQRTLKESMRKLMLEISSIIPDIKYDIDKPIDNRNVLQTTAIMEKLKKRVAVAKDVSRKLEAQRFDLKMETQRLQDDLRLGNEKAAQANIDLKQKKKSWQLQRQQLIAESENLSKSLQNTQQSIEELEKQLSMSQSPQDIELKISEDEAEIAELLRKLQIYRDISKHQNDQVNFLKEDVAYRLEMSLLLAQYCSETSGS